MLTPTEPATVPIVLHSSMSLHARNLLTLPYHHYKALNTSKYQGSFITPTSSSVPDVDFRCSQASSATFSAPTNLPKIQTPRLLTNCAGHSPPRVGISSILTCSNYQDFRIKSPYFHRVVSPTDSPCSNEFLLSLSYPVLPSCVPSSLRISDSD